MTFLSKDTLDKALALYGFTHYDKAWRKESEKYSMRANVKFGDR